MEFSVTHWFTSNLVEGPKRHVPSGLSELENDIFHQ